MKKIIVDYRIDATSSAELSKLGFDVVYTKPIKGLYYEVCGHTDMQIHIVNGKAICEPTVYDHYKEQLNELEVIKGSVMISGKYPGDIAYNTCSLGKYGVCKKDSTAIEIIREYKDIIDTRQGYAKCSICVAGTDSVITADKGIYNSLKLYGFNVLKIRPGYISLYNMTGFIGGVSGLIEKNILAFNGDIKTHPDYFNIRDFCRNIGTEMISLNKGELKDIGSIIRIF